MTVLIPLTALGVLVWALWPRRPRCSLHGHSHPRSLMRGYTVWRDDEDE